MKDEGGKKIWSGSLWLPGDLSVSQVKWYDTIEFSENPKIIIRDVYTEERDI
jgi:hypothetical protein